eukprot:NODE_4035_length_704_cov_66.995420_g3411_i0.p2 GENE.NODE_4035_length_704_cov_66.995420_g3411_i0~~NODE_4035_length_704_cov_66.995420_g3411_i0.p2  ORF type:complete len:128 (+),score=24.15 NODE_4035_length_704_cov_66.995420_g3411_i0:282-665(+)
MVLSGQALGFVVWRTGALRALAPALISVLGWKMDQVGPFAALTGPCIAFYHELDGIIPLPCALCTNSEAAKKVSHQLRLCRPLLEQVNPVEAGGAYHNYDISEDRTQWPELLLRLQELFPSRGKKLD